MATASVAPVGATAEAAPGGGAPGPVVGGVAPGGTEVGGGPRCASRRRLCRALRASPAPTAATMITTNPTTLYGYCCRAANRPERPSRLTSTVVWLEP